MATKWKNSKPAVAFAAFFLGISMLAYSLSALAGASAWGWNSAYGARDVFAGNYQNTAAFRGEISNTLASFLAMATGGPVDGYSWDNTYYSTWDDWAYSGFASNEPSVVEAEEYQHWLEYQNSTNVIHQSTASSGGYIWDVPEMEPERVWVGPTYTGDSDLPEDELEALAQWKAACERQAEAANKRYAEDKNILYSISYDGKEKYTNASGISGASGASGVSGASGAALSADPAALPEGYNFLLVYEKGAVKIWQDGKAIDVYGDGYYRDGEGWCVPGYKNFTVDEESMRATVILAAASSPKLDVKGRYANGGTNWYYSGLYGVEQRLVRLRRQYMQGLTMAAASLALLALAWAMRGALRTAKRSIARLTGRVWFECKAFAALLLVLCLFAWHSREFGYTYDASVLYMWGGNFSSSEEVRAYLLDTFLSSLRTLLWDPIVLLAIFWLVWLLWNDLRRNEKPWRKNLYQDVFCARGLRLPITQRLVRRAGWTFAAALLLAVCGLFCMIVFPIHRYGTISVGACGIFFGALAVLMALFLQQNRALAGQVETVTGHISAMRSGALETPLTLPAGSDLAAAADDLHDLQRGMHTAIEEQMKSERMKVALVANVSHDIKTPLTSIISYIELLRDEPDLPEHVRDYVRILDEKSQRLKTMVQDVFEVSKAASGDLPVKLEELDFAKLLRQTLADMSERIAGSPVTVKAELPEDAVMIVADGQRMYRVFQNLIGNALQYSLEGSRVYIALRTENGRAVAAVRNTSRDEIPDGVDFTARFVRGDESRTDGGSGLGLSIASSFTEACGGEFSIAPVADLFTATVSFPLAK